MALLAARQALQQAGFMPPHDHPLRGALLVGSTLGESTAFESAGAQLASRRSVGGCSAQAVASIASEGADGLDNDRDTGTLDASTPPTDDAGATLPTVAHLVRGLAQALRLSGPTQALATACAAGNYAIAGAVMALRRDPQLPFALAGGAEPFSQLAMVGFARSRAMASERCRPFDARRSGMVLGEGAAMFVLERAEDAFARGATPLAEVVGFGLSCDAHHPTAPRPDGDGMARAMEQALRSARLPASAVDWVNLHGTGTRASDAAEGLALRRVFAAVAQQPVLSGSKGALGHALGAAAALEAALCVQGLMDGCVPPTAGHEEEDPAIGLGCTRLAVHDRPPQVVLNNAFAFGGVNSCLVLRRWSGDSA